MKTYRKHSHLASTALLALAVTTCVAAKSRAENAVVYSTDFTSAYYSSMATSPPYTPNINITLTCADAVTRSSGDLVAVIGRSACDYLQLLNPQNGFATTAQWSTGNGTNPQDFVSCSPSKVYVSLYERDFLLIMNPQTGQHLGQIDISDWNDSDGLPEASSMVRVGDRAFVALQRLDRVAGYSASNTSYVLVIDCNTDSLVDADPQTPGTQGIELSARNPFDDLIFDPVRQKIAVTCAGNFGVLDGGVEWIDPVTLQAEGLVITEATLGGDLNRNRMYVDCTGYAIINDSSFNTMLVQYDHCSGTLLGTCRSTAGFNLADVEIDGAGVLYLVERDLITPGVRLYQLPACNEITTSPISFGLPPQDLELVGDCEPTPASTPGVSPQQVHLSRNQPDPFNPATSMWVAAPVGSFVVVDVVDVRGQHVQRIWEGIVQRPNQRLDWNGRNTTGQAVASGVYFAVLKNGSTTRTERMTLLR
jgi:hypothetical protein